MELRELFFLVLSIQCAYFFQDVKTEECKDKKNWCPRYTCTHSFVRKYCPKRCNLCPKVILQPAKTAACTGLKLKRNIYYTPYKIKSTHGTFPWQAALKYKNQFFCGGTLITKNHILTGAQCLAGVGNDYRNIKVVLGEYNLLSTDGTEQTITVKKMTIHEQFSPLVRRYDIAILELVRAVRTTDRITPICLPDKGEEVNVGERCIMSGWSRRYPSLNFEKKLKQAGVPVVNAAECRRKNTFDSNKVSNDMLCTGYNQRSYSVSICHGDSGGPITCKKRGGTWKVYGIQSWGSPTCNGLEHYSVNTKVSAYRSWIDKHTV